MLKVASRDDWTKDVGFARVLSALGDQRVLPRDLPPDLERVSIGETSLRVKPSLGRIRYVSQERAWNPDSNARTRPLDSTRAQEVVVAALAALNVPRDELGPPVSLTQVAASGPLTSRVPTEKVEIVPGRHVFPPSQRPVGLRLEGVSQRQSSRRDPAPADGLASIPLDAGNGAAISRCGDQGGVGTDHGAVARRPAYRQRSAHVRATRS